MADWNKPEVSSTYANYTAEIKALASDLARGNDPALTTLTNPITNTIRWVAASNRWEKYNGTSWVALASTYAINAATASAWLTGRTIALTGDATGTSAAWTGSANVSFAVTLATVNANVGSFGSATAVPVITVNGKGLITAISTAALGNMANQTASAVAITGGAISNVTFTLKQSTTAAPTAEGVMEWDTDGDELKIGTGAGTKTVVNTDNAQTLTNKTMGAGSTWGGTAVPVANGGTGAGDAATAQTNLNVPSRTGTGASGTWGISISGNAATATSAATLTTARTINGVSFNGSANITVTANTTQALTVSSAGTGVASGTTFNGSTARTISYNSIGAPSATGAGASGTWGIDITGTAPKLLTAGFSVEEIAGEIVIKFGTTIIAKINSAGDILAKGDVKAAQVI